MEDFVKILEPFKVAQKQLEGEKYCTASAVPYAVYKSRRGLKKGLESPQATVRNQAEKMLKDFKNRWGAEDSSYWKAQGDKSMERSKMQRQKGIHRVFIIAAVLDPRWRSYVLDEGLKVDDESKMKIEEEVLTLMVQVFHSAIDTDEEEDEDQGTDDKDEDNEPITFSSSDEEMSISSLDRLRMEHKSGNHQPAPIGNPEQKCQDEWNRFKQEMVLNPKKSPFDWWKKKQVAYPTLAVLARQFLAVQATSAPSERLFSRASRIISNNRTRLDPEVAGKLFYVSENIKWYDEQVKKENPIE